MRAWLESIAGPEYASALIWTLGALILLLVILVIVRIVRGLTFGTFVAGGRNRKTRLAVMDATAVDSHRRLVLVRRDDVEHLILIGGPTDVVVEQNIRLQSPSRRTLPHDRDTGYEAGPRQTPESLKPPAAAAAPPPEPAVTHKPVEASRPATATTQTPLSRPTPQPATGTLARPSAAPAQAAPQRPAQAAPAVAAPSAAPAAGKGADVDDALLKELEVTLGERTPKPAPEAGSKKADDEMSKLLGDLSAQRK
ncbi:MAG: flagellar biosynthetic protein FliO [Rhizobiaceae bacterium]|nr:flagellar biosynthetic protein FliO [Rhizobiaceae bacterium]